MTKPTRPPVVDPPVDPPDTEVPVTPGFAVDVSRPTAPEMRLEISKDGGKTWHPLPSRSLGAIGEYSKRVKWWQCGTGRDLVLRFTTSEAVPLAVLDVVVDVEGNLS